VSAQFITVSRIEVEGSMSYYMTIESGQVEPSHSTIAIDNAQGLITDVTLPLVSVEIGELSLGDVLNIYRLVVLVTSVHHYM